MKITYTFGRYVLISTISLLPISAHSTVILDQSFTPTRNFYWTLGSPLWQTFTAGISGMLDSVEVLGVKLAPQIGAHDLMVEIRDSSFNNVLGLASLTPGQVYSATGDSVVFPPGGTATFIHFDLASEHIEMVAGETYYLSVDAINPGVINWLGSESGGYTGGRAVGNARWDLGFRSYVAQVPEPGALWLVGIGLVGLLGFYRKPKGTQ